MAAVSQIISCASAVYCVALGISRHGTFEDLGFSDTAQEVVLASLPALGLLISAHMPMLALAPAASLALCWRNYKKYVYGRQFQPVDLTGKVYVITGYETKYSNFNLI